MKAETAKAIGTALGELIGGAVNASVVGALLWGATDIAFEDAWMLGCAAVWLAVVARGAR